MKLKEHLEQLLQDEEFAAAYEDLEPFFQIAEDVIRLRLERGWSQEELARRVGTRQANISRLENGLSNPTVKFLQRVAKAFGVKLEIRLGKERPREAAATRSKESRSTSPGTPQNISLPV
ncbi:MAG TPA: XRE family transcriptional regulator [Anaerolineae bacterium]|nr:XRE family transcriptional regulator [Anaerolineae bacterium]